VSSIPRLAPSSLNWTPTTPTLSEAVAETFNLVNPKHSLRRRSGQGNGEELPISAAVCVVAEEIKIEWNYYLPRHRPTLHKSTKYWSKTRI